MKRTLQLCILTFLSTLPLFAVDQVFLEPFNPVTPEILAVGKASTANVRGYNSLFLNPAAFSIDQDQGLTFTLQASPLMPISAMNKVLGNPGAFKSFNVSNAGNSDVSLVNDVVTKYGLGVQSSFGVGYVGNGLGLGLVYDERAYAKGPLLLGTAATVDLTTGLCLGYSLPVDVKVTTLHLGLEMRPMAKTYGKVPLTSVLGSGSNMANIPVYTGFGMGWDLGAIAQFGEFSTGIALRDIGSTMFNFKQVTLTDSLKPASYFSTSSSTSTVYRIPMTVALGGSWKPEIPLYKNIFEPKFMVDFQVPLEDEYTQPSFLTWIHAGVDTKILSFMSLRMGLNQGYFTMGMGVRVFCLDVNWAIYADELGRYAGTNKRSGFSLQTALKF